MPRGFSLHIGVNKVDPQSFFGRNFVALTACLADADEMLNISIRKQYTSRVKLLDGMATWGNVKKQIEFAAKELKNGDIFFISFSGHGWYRQNIGGDIEPTGQDQMWCLSDGGVLDDELYKLWNTFQSGVRIVVVSDSCHSGSVICSPIAPPLSEVYIARAMALHARKTILGAHLILLAASQDSQSAKEGEMLGVFTQALVSAWNNDKFTGTYEQFYQLIKQKMAASTRAALQEPNYFTLNLDGKFELETPFQI